HSDHPSRPVPLTPPSSLPLIPPWFRRGAAAARRPDPSAGPQPRPPSRSPAPHGRARRRRPSSKEGGTPGDGKEPHMGRYLGPKVKLSRRVGVPIADNPKHTSKSQLNPAGMHG